MTPSRTKPSIRMKLFKKSKGALDDENNGNAAINPTDTSDEPVTPVPKRRKSCWNVDFGARSYTLVLDRMISPKKFGAGASYFGARSYCFGAESYIIWC